MIDDGKPSIEELIHFGVKGMRWGVRNTTDMTPRAKPVGFGPSRVERTTAKGDKLVLSKDPPNALIKGLSRLSTRYTETYNSQAFLTISDKSGKKIGDAVIRKKNDDELYLSWLGIKKSERGQGYATEAMKTAAELGKQAGFKKLTLEVPGNSPDARHIYEKLGFKVIEENIDPSDLVWGGLTTMEYNIK